MRMRIGAAAVAGIIGLAVSGGAVLAAFEPQAPAALAASTDTGAATAVHAEKGGDALRAVLERLVANGTLTREQADKILAAVKSAADEAREKAKERLEERKQKAKEQLEKAKEKAKERLEERREKAKERKPAAPKERKPTERKPVPSPSASPTT